MSGRHWAHHGAKPGKDVVVWATGYRLDYSWIKIPSVTDANGRVCHRRGVTDSRGLYFLGLTWQWTRGSALVGFVGDDAAFLAARIVTALQDYKLQYRRAGHADRR
jgi:putative flavoprotein involved in K+ transport